MEAGHPLLIIVTGPPASGKTTIATEISRQLGVPAFHKDEIKERLAEGIPGSGIGWSKNLGSASYELLFHIGHTLIATGHSCLLEANFHPQLSASALQPLALNSEAVQVICGGKPEALAERYLQRHASGQRHHVHMDNDPARRDELEAAFRRDHQLPIPGLALHCDTTQEQAVDVSSLVERIRTWKSDSG